MSANNLVPAAQYVRMSTEHQQYSPNYLKATSNIGRDYFGAISVA
jgi:hypothetical protein